jgi:hypothetical protein
MAGDCTDWFESLAAKLNAIGPTGTYSGPSPALTPGLPRGYPWHCTNALPIARRMAYNAGEG